MKKNVFIFFLLFLYMQFPIHSQTHGFSVRMGFGTYSMQRMKEFNINQQLYYQSSDLQIDQNANFPGYFNYSIETFYDINNTWRINNIFQFLSTGSRLSYSDYSGTIKIDDLAAAYTIGFGLFKSLVTHSFHAGLYANPQVLFCNNHFKNNIIIGEQSNNNDSWAHSLNIGIEAGGFIRKQVQKHIELEARTGYYQDIYKSYLRMSSGRSNYYKVDWSGFRCSIGINYLL